MANTERAVAVLARQIEEVRSRDRDGTEAVDSPAVFPPDKAEPEKAEVIMGSCWSVRINSGKFGVDWSRTRTVLERGTLDIHVVRPASEDLGEKIEKVQESGDDETRINSSSSSRSSTRGIKRKRELLL